MKNKKTKEQFKIADVLYEMGLDFDVIETISGISAQDLLLNKINFIDNEEEKSNNELHVLQDSSEVELIKEENEANEK